MTGCALITSQGFLGIFPGLWDGLTAIISLTLSIFWDVQFYNSCANGWFYNLGFIVGIVIGMAIGLNSPTLFVVVMIVMLVVKFFLIMFNGVAWGIGIGLGIVFVLVLYHRLTGGAWRLN